MRPMDEENDETEENEEGFFAGFVVYVDDIDVFRRLNALLSKFYGAKLITAKLNDGRLYITSRKPEDFKETLGRKQ